MDLLPLPILPFAVINLLSPNKLQYMHIQWYAVQLSLQAVVITSSPDPRSSVSPTHSNIHDTLSTTPGRYTTALHRLLTDAFTQSSSVFPQRDYLFFPHSNVPANLLNKHHEVHTHTHTHTHIYIYVYKWSTDACGYIRSHLQRNDWRFCIDSHINKIGKQVITVHWQRRMSNMSSGSTILW
jgi:hypothetical protein